MKTAIPLPFAILLACLCVFVCQAWTFKNSTNPAEINTQGPQALLCGLPVSETASKYKYTASLSQISALDSICVHSSSALRITGFNMITMPQKGYMEQVNCNVNRFGDVVKKLMSKLGPGDLIVFDEITARGSDGVSLKLSSFSVLLK